MIKKPNQVRLEKITALLEHGNKTSKQIAAMTGYSRRSVQDYLLHIAENKPGPVPASPQAHETPRPRPTVSKARKHAPTADTPQDPAIKTVYQGTGRTYRLVVGLPDMHLPYSFGGILSPSAQAAIRFCHEGRPDEIVLMGDYLDLKCINRKDLPGDLKGHYLKRDLKIGNLVLDMLSATTRKITYMEGNHEIWLKKYEAKDPHGLAGMLDIRDQLRLWDRKIDLIPENCVYMAGDASMIHGWFVNDHHAKATVIAHGDTVFYGHAHNVQSYSLIGRPGSTPRIGQACGSLCHENPFYLRNKPNKWVSGFLILHVRDDGGFDYYVPIIQNGRFAYGGKEYAA